MDNVCATHVVGKLIFFRGGGMVAKTRRSNQLLSSSDMANLKHDCSAKYEFYYSQRNGKKRKGIIFFAYTQLWEGIVVVFVDRI